MMLRSKGTLCQYGSCAITHDFTGSEIITKVKVYMVLQHYVKKIAKVAQHKYTRPSWKIMEVGSNENKCICAI